MTTATTDAHTDMAPLIPHRNAVGAPGRKDAIFIPIRRAATGRCPNECGCRPSLGSKVLLGVWSDRLEELAQQEVRPERRHEQPERLPQVYVSQP